MGSTNHKWAQGKRNYRKENRKKKTGSSGLQVDQGNLGPNFSPGFSILDNLGQAEGVNVYGNQPEESYIVRSNFRIRDNLDLNIGDKIWKSISNLGVVMEDSNKDYKKILIEMEKKDRTRNEGRKVQSNNCQ